MGRRNPVAKHASQFNRSSIQPDKKKDYKRTEKHKKKLHQF